MGIESIKAPGAGEVKETMKVAVTPAAHSMVKAAAKSLGRRQSEVIERLITDNLAHYAPAKG